MALKDNFIDPTFSITDGGLNNTEPEYQKFIPYVELYVVRNDKTGFLFTTEGMTKKMDVGDGIVSLMGIDTLTNSYTTNYTEDISGTNIKESPDEGVGITDIDIDVKSRYVPKVNITIVDVKGSSIMNPMQLQSSTKGEIGGSKYSTIFNFPPPTYVLILKGAFGKAVRYVLHGLSTNVEYDSESGNFIIKLSLIGKTFAPLSDIKMGWIKAAPYMLDDKKIINGSVTDKVTSSWELEVYGNQLYTDLKELTSSSTEQEDIGKNNDKIDQLKSFQSSITEIELDDNLKPTPFKDQVIKGGMFTFDENGIKPLGKVFNTEGIVVWSGFIVKIDSKDINLIKSTKDKLLEHKKKLLNDEYKLLIGGNINEKNEIQIIQLYDIDPSGVDNKNFVRFLFEYSLYDDHIIKKIKSLINDNNTINNELLNKSRNIVTQTSNFTPNIYNITKIIADDIDIFFNILNEAGDTERKSSINGEISVLEDGAFPQVTIKRNDRQYNIYPAADEIIISNPSFNDWKEVKFVEKFIETYLKQKTLEEEIEELKKINDDGSSKLIPISPLDTNLLGDDKTLSYQNKITDDEFITNIFRRYFISTQYTNKGYWSNSYKEEQRKSFISFLAKAEVENILASITDETLIGTIKTFFQGLNYDDIYTSLDNIFKDQNNRINKYPLLYNFLYKLDNSDRKSYELNNGKIIYSFSTNENYNGLTIKDDYDVKLVDSSTLESNDEKPTKLLLDFIEGPWYKSSSDLEKPKLTTDNLLFFEDVYHKDNNTYNSDFIDYFGDEEDDVSDMNFLQFYIDKTKETGGRSKKVNNLKELEINLFYYIKQYNLFEINEKFLYNGITECIEIFLIKFGKLLKNNEIVTTLSIKDKNLIISYYDKFVSNANIYIDNYNKLFNKDNVVISELSTSELFKMFFNRVYLINETAFTFIDLDSKKDIIDEKEELFHALLGKNTDGEWFEKLVKYDTGYFGGNEGDDRFTIFNKVFSNKLIDGLNNKLEAKKQKVREIKKTIRDTDLKTQLYESFRNVYHRWLKGGNGYKDNNLSYPNSMGTSLIEKFKFIDRGFNDIGQTAIVDFTDIIDRLQNSSDSEVYGTLSSFYSKNNFEFFVLPNFINYNNQRDTWVKSFSLTETTEIKTTPTFTCMYVGGYSSDSSDTIKTNDVSEVVDLTDNVYGFQIPVGKQNQTIFKDLKFNTEEFKETGESLKMMDDVFKNINKNNAPLFKGQNLYEVYQNRSYSTTVTIPFGNMLIQPTQYFEVLNVPLFNGLYIILGVQHKFSASSNKLETTITGSRIRRYISPIVISPIVDFTGVFSELTQIAKSVEMNSNTKTPTTQILNLTADDILYRNDNNITKPVVKQLNNGTYVNTENVIFKQQSINTNNLGKLKKY